MERTFLPVQPGQPFPPNFKKAASTCPLRQKMFLNAVAGDQSDLQAFVSNLCARFPQSLQGTAGSEFIEHLARSRCVVQTCSLQLINLKLEKMHVRRFTLCKAMAECDADAHLPFAKLLPVCDTSETPGNGPGTTPSSISYIS